jgi:FkbM family methyltransferase
MMALFPPGFKGFMVDVGAYDPVVISNSWLFEQKGWRTLCIEPNPDLEEKLKRERDLVLSVACGAENKESIPLEIFVMQPQPGLPITLVNEGAITGIRTDDVEVNTERYRQYELHKPLIIEQKVTDVPLRTLDWCLEAVRWKPPCHIVSIDVEGTEMDVLKGFDVDKWQPHVFCIESWFKDDRYEKYLEPFGFSLVIKTHDGINEIFMHKERMKVLHEMSD